MKSLLKIALLSLASFTLMSAFPQSLVKAGIVVTSTTIAELEAAEQAAAYQALSDAFFGNAPYTWGLADRCEDLEELKTQWDTAYVAACERSGDAYEYTGNYNYYLNELTEQWDDSLDADSAALAATNAEINALAVLFSLQVSNQYYTDALDTLFDVYEQIGYLEATGEHMIEQANLYYDALEDYIP